MFKLLSRNCRLAGKRYLRSMLIVVIGLGLFVACLPGIAVAVTPESPEVQAMVTKALAYLENATDEKNRLGAHCLVGLAFLKNGHGEEHPKIKFAVAQCQRITKAEPANIQTDLYSTGIAIIFLCELDPSRYHEEIMKLLESQALRQKPHGGWGYASKPTGDTSMTQYSVLSMWEAQKAGFAVSEDSIERVAHWLLRTQDPSGGWGYQGNDPGVTSDGKYALVKQGGVRLSMTSAGLGCMYICADMLGAVPPPPENDPDVPAVLKPVRDAVAQPNNWKSQRIKLTDLQRAQEKGQTWLRNNFEIAPPKSTHYYLYALERAQSFADAATGRDIKEPRWYNEGVAYLKRTQLENGGWKTELNEVHNTAFAVLFLVRSTKKSIENARGFGAGKLVGAAGLPPDLTVVRLQAGQIVAEQPADAVAELLEILGDPVSARFDAVAGNAPGLGRKIAAASGEELATYIRELSRLARHDAAAVRQAAIETLGYVRDIDAALPLIQALDDANFSVARRAEEALQRLCGRLGAHPLPTADDAPARERTRDDWTNWLSSVRPR